MNENQHPGKKTNKYDKFLTLSETSCRNDLLTLFHVFFKTASGNEVEKLLGDAIIQASFNIAQNPNPIIFIGQKRDEVIS